MKIDSSADVIRHLAKRENKKLKEIAQNIGQSSSNFSYKLKNNNLTAQDFIKALGYMGYSIYLAKNDKQVIPEIRKGIGDPLKGMVEGVMYDTVKSDAVCHTECIYGMHVELYRDAEGRFFVAEYAEWGNGKNNISPIAKKDAYRLYKAYGDGSCDYMFE